MKVGTKALAAALLLLLLGQQSCATTGRGEKVGETLMGLGGGIVLVGGMLAFATECDSDAGCFQRPQPGLSDTEIAGGLFAALGLATAGAVTYLAATRHRPPSTYVPSPPLTTPTPPPAPTPIVPLPKG
jgi:hypothetical protein